MLDADAYAGADLQNVFTYGDSIIVKTRVSYPDGNSGISAQADVSAPAARQIALYWGNTRISEPVDALTDGEYSLIYNTVNRVVPIGEQTLTVRFIGDDTVGGASRDVKVTLNAAEPGVAISEGQKTEFLYGEEVKIEEPDVALPALDGEWKYAFSFRKEGETVGTNDTPVLAGNYVVTVSVEADPDGFWTAAAGEFSLTILRRPVTVFLADMSKTYGEEDPAFVYTVDEKTPLVSGESLNGAPVRAEGENAGTYPITQGSLNDGNNPNYQITCAEGTFTIKPAAYQAKAETVQTILVGAGSFREPAFVGVRNEAISGTLVYTYAGREYTYEELVEELKTKELGETGTILAVFTPDAGGNYVSDRTEVSIDFTISDIQFMVGDQGASEANAVIRKEAVVYGDTWDQIIRISDGLSARVGDLSDNQKEHFTLSVSGYPAAGSGLPYAVLYNGTIGGKTYTDVVVCSGTVDVARALLTWNTDGLTALDSLLRIVDGKATLSGSLQVSGILAGDIGKVSFSCPADRLTGSYVEVASGKQKVLLSWAGEAAVLEGDAAGNYRLPDGLPEITGQINPSERKPAPGLSADRYQLEIETGLSEIPEALRNDPALNTTEKIEARMRLNLREKSSSIPDSNMMLYDVRLMISTDGQTWVEATAENFPSEGILVTLPYPSGTGKDTHNFTVVHMYTVARDGYRPGDVEYPAVKKTDSGIEFRVNSLSPIAVGWQTIERPAQTTDPSSSGTSSAGTKDPNQTTGVQTGDRNDRYLYLLLLLAAGTSVCLLLEKRRTGQR